MADVGTPTDVSAHFAHGSQRSVRDALYPMPDRLARGPFAAGEHTHKPATVAGIAEPGGAGTDAGAGVATHRAAWTQGPVVHSRTGAGVVL